MIILSNFHRKIVVLSFCRCPEKSGLYGPVIMMFDWQRHWSLYIIYVYSTNKNWHNDHEIGPLIWFNHVKNGSATNQNGRAEPKHNTGGWWFQHVSTMCCIGCKLHPLGGCKLHPVGGVFHHQLKCRGRWAHWHRRQHDSQVALSADDPNFSDSGIVKKTTQPSFDRQCPECSCASIHKL